jgi:SagB-type dehydrogenase family enzyme
VIPNNDVDAAWKYHNGSKHSYVSIRTHPHFLDWENHPLPYKIYPTLEVMRLPKDMKTTGVPVLSAISGLTPPTSGEVIPDVEALSHLLFLSAGVTKSKKYPGGETFFRAAACTGALYEMELYLVCGDLPGLSAGVYHFGVAEFGLRQLRAGDFRAAVVDATGNLPSVAHAPVIVVCSGTYWRNAWKYRSRSYRHFGWDNGTILANLLATASALGFPAEVVCGFVDSKVNALLDVDTQREVAFSLVALGRGSSVAASAAEIGPLGFPVVPYSKTEVDYPAMRQMHEASSLATPEEVTAWRSQPYQPRSLERVADVIRLQPLDDSQIPSDSLEQVILRRGSTRRFSRDPISLAQLSTMLDRATRGIPAEFLQPPGTQLNDLYLMVNNVEGMEPGAYFFNRAERQLDLLKEGNFRDQAGYLGLEQELPGDASVDFFFLADLGKIFSTFGNRGYRATQLEAGIIGGKLYLAAYGMGLGASGLTFYDDDVVKFFSPHAKGKSAIFLVAAGKSSSRTTP